MASDHRSAADIEREIEEERSALARTLDEIHDRLSFESLSNDLMGRVRDGSGDIGRSIVRTARENPIPVALTAVGLAWLLAGRGFGRSDAAEADPYARAASIPASARWADENRRDRDFPAGPRNLWGSARGVYSDARDTAREAAESTRETGRAAAEGVREAASGLGEAAREAWRSGRDQLASGTRSAREHLREGVDAAGDAAEAGASSARHYVRGAGKALRRGAHEAYASAAELRDRISEGTEDLSATARKRVVAARTRAYEAQLRAEHYAARSRERASDLFEEQPLVAGALALAVGAAIGGLLPRTRREDAALGAHRDQVFDEAERIYRDERDRIATAAREAAREAGDVAKDLAHDIKGDVEKGAEQAGDIARAKLAETETRVRDAAEKVTDKARREAEKHGHG